MKLERLGITLSKPVRILCVVCKQIASIYTNNTDPHSRSHKMSHYGLTMIWCSSGKVRYIGSSTFPAWMIMEALSISESYNLVRLLANNRHITS